MPLSVNPQMCVWALALTVFAAPGALAQTNATPPSLADARHSVVTAEIDLQTAESESKKACEEATAADGQLLKEGLSPSNLTRALARDAQTKRGWCEHWKQVANQAKARAEAARLQLQEVAASAPAAPASASASAPTTARPGPWQLPARVDLETIVAQAMEAQERVGKERKAAAGVYDTVDKATKAALALTQATDTPRLGDSLEMQANAKAAKTAGHDAQVAATQLLEYALRIHTCLIAGALDCGAVHADNYHLARASRDRMNDNLSKSKRLREHLDAAAASIEVALAWPDPTQRIKALQFAKLIEKYPDASAPFAQNAFTLLASDKDKSAVVKMGWDRLYAGGWRNVSLSFTAPLGDRVFSYVDGMTGLPKVGLGYQRASVSKALKDRELLYTTGAALQFGYDKRSYYKDGPAFPKGSTDIRVSPWDLSGAVVLHDPSTNNAHVLRMSWQHTFEDGPSKNRCPVDTTGDAGFVDCITGKFGAPKARNAGLLRYQYRYQTDAFAVSPTLSYNTRSRVTEVGLPLYLVRDADDDKRPFNAGIRADWTSKGKAAITGTTKNTWSFGVFVGTSFSLFSRAE